MDLTCQRHKELKQLLTADNDDEIASDIYLLARKIKYRRNLPTVELTFYCKETENHQNCWLKFNVKTSITVSQLKDEIQAKRKVRTHVLKTAFDLKEKIRVSPLEKFPSSLYYNEKKMEGDLDKYKLQSGDKIRYVPTKI